MKASENIKPYLQIHTAVILFGFTAILGELIHLPAVMLVWWRVLITTASLFILIRFGQTLKTLPRKVIIRFLLIGCIIGAHWVTFYGSLKLSNASVCLICMSTTTFFTSFMEPMIIGRKFDKIEILTGSLMIPGMFLIVNNLDIGYLYGVITGLIAAALAALFSVLTKLYIDDTDPVTISFIELSGSLIMVSIVIAIMTLFGFTMTSYIPTTGIEWFYLIIFALVCTTFAQILTLKALKQLSTFTVNLTINLEPIYGILLAIVILNEHKDLNLMFYIGATIIMVSVFSFPFIKRYKKQKAL